MIFNLSPNDIDIWYVHFKLVTPNLYLKYLSILSTDEQNRYGRFIFEKDRRQFLIARALLRTVLSKYCKITPQEWRFKTNDYGKPEIDLTPETSLLRFNLSHTAGLAACAVTVGKEIGIDVEFINRKTLNLETARSVFAQTEVEYLETVPEHRLTDALFEIWTLKESYIKALGFGLSVPLKDFAFTLNPIRFYQTEQANDNLTLWEFAVMKPTLEHTLALAFQRDRLTEIKIKFANTVPFDTMSF